MGHSVQQTFMDASRASRKVARAVYVVAILDSLDLMRLVIGWRDLYLPRKEAGRYRTRRPSLSLLLRIVRWNALSIPPTVQVERAIAWAQVLDENVHVHLRIRNP